MLRSKDEATPDRLVYLYPHTKTAGQWCWRRKPAVIIDADHWPRVHVCLTDGDRDIEAYIHKDDIKLKPDKVTTRGQGDMASGDTVIELGSSRRLALHGGTKKYEIDLPDGVEQGELW
jgi:hypothetical protein